MVFLLQIESFRDKGTGTPQGLDVGAVLQLSIYYPSTNLSSFFSTILAIRESLQNSYTCADTEIP